MAAKEKNKPEHGGGQSELVQRFKANPLMFIGTFLILILIVLAFVLVPAMVPSSERAAGDWTFGFYNKRPIAYVTDNYFYSWQQMLLRYYQDAMTEADTPEIFKQIWLQAYWETVVHTAMLDEMKLAGYTAPPDKVDREVASMPQFQQNGRFSVIRYEQMENNARMNLWNMTQDGIAVGRYTSDFESLRPSTRESSFISSMAYPQRSFDMVSFPVTSYPDSEVRVFAEENRSLFTATRLSRITINSSEREARQVLASIQDGTRTFEDAARESSQDFDAERGGEMGSRMAFELEYYIPGTEERESVARLSSGNFSDVIQVGERSWAFFRADDNPRPADLDDQATLDRIRSYVYSYEWGRAEDWAISEAGRFAAAARESGFADAAMEIFTEVQHFGPLPVNYGDVDLFPSLATESVPALQNAGRNEQFWSTAFSTPLLEPSVPVVAGYNVVVLYPLEELQTESEWVGYLESYFQSVVPQRTGDAIRLHFLTSDKLDDRFAETFYKNWGY